MIYKSRLALVLVLCATAGCATIFTGSSQRVTVTTDPPQAYVIVIGTPTASLILAAHESRAVTGKVLALFGPMLSPGARAKLEMLDVDELITRLVMWVKLDRIPPELVGEMDRLPPFARDRLLDLLTVKAVGTSPLTVKLKKGREYAVISWAQGHRARSVGIQPTFNWVTLLNVFNAFLGVPIDILTGAWFNLSPGKIELRLTPLAGPAG